MTEIKKFWDDIPEEEVDFLKKRKNPDTNNVKEGVNNELIELL